MSPLLSLQLRFAVIRKIFNENQPYVSVDNMNVYIYRYTKFISDILHMRIKTIAETRKKNTVTISSIYIEKLKGKT